MKITAAKKNIDYKCIIEKDVTGNLVGDSLRLRQVILNLAGNAVKFTEKGSVTVHVSMINKDDFFILLKFEISDTGIGIPENKINRLFKSFSQVDESTTRKYGGTGLGLMISKQLVEMMNGKIHIKSQPGKGTTFWFTINYELSRTDNIKDCLDEKKNLQEHKTLIRDIKILIAEDNSINQKVAISILKNLKHRDVIIAENGKKAVELYKTQKFDLILMDGQMPEMDGIEATKAIRQIEVEENYAEQIPIIAVTASVMEGDKERFIAAGMNDYISKPLKIKELEKVIAHNLPEQLFDRSH